MTVSYGATVIQNGQPYQRTAVAALPQLYLTPTTESAANFNSSSLFTVMLADASAVVSIRECLLDVPLIRFV